MKNCSEEICSLETSLSISFKKLSLISSIIDTTSIIGTAATDSSLLQDQLTLPLKGDGK